MPRVNEKGEIIRDSVPPSETNTSQDTRTNHGGHGSKFGGCIRVALVLLALYLGIQFISNSLQPSNQQHTQSTSVSRTFEQHATSTDSVTGNKTPEKLALEKTVLPTNTPIIKRTEPNCSTAAKPRIEVDDLIEVKTTKSDPLRLRSSPDISYDNIKIRLAPGTQLKVVDGPICVKDDRTGNYYWFWEVKVRGTNEIGWVAEGQPYYYYVEKVDK